MKWLLSKLGLLKQDKNNQDLKEDLSFFKTSLHANANCMSMASGEANPAFAEAKQGVTVNDQNQGCIR